MTGRPTRPTRPATTPTPAPPVTATVIGVDASLTATGLAVWHDGRWTFDTIHTTPDGMTLEQRWRHITARIWHCLTDRCLVVVEGVFSARRSHGGAALDLAMLHGIIRYGLHVRTVPFTVVNTTHLKQFATGGGNAKKFQMLAAARERLGLPLASHDQGDAAWLAAMGLHRYGHPLCPTTPVQDAACHAARWPQFTLEHRAEKESEPEEERNTQR